MRVRAYMSIGLVGCKREEWIDVPDDELAEAATAQEREDLINEIVETWFWNHASYWWDDPEGAP